MTIIDVPELTSYLRLGAEVDVDAAGLLVELTNGLIVEEIGEIDPWPTRVRAIALEVAGRAYRNPDGYQSESVDDYTYRRAEGGAGVFLSSGEVGQLLALVGRAPSVRSVRLRSASQGPPGNIGTLPTP